MPTGLWMPAASSGRAQASTTTRVSRAVPALVPVRDLPAAAARSWLQDRHRVLALWRAGEPISRQYLELRYRLLPYIYAWRARHREPASLSCARFVFDFRDDDEALDEATAICSAAPSTLRRYRAGCREWPVYLPGTAGGWFDLWTGEHREGGKYHDVARSARIASRCTPAPVASCRSDPSCSPPPRQQTRRSISTSFQAVTRSSSSMRIKVSTTPTKAARTRSRRCAGMKQAASSKLASASGPSRGCQCESGSPSIGSAPACPR